jgi:hypothetical protein
METNDMKTRCRLLGLLLTLVITAQASPASADTTSPFTSSFANLVTGAGTLPFSFPRFDRSLGSLQSVDIAWDFSGTVVGSASGVSQSSSINSTITHWVFFHFDDLSDRVFIAEPSLRLTAGIPAGAQNTAVAFGPEFQSTSFSFSVTSGDWRFDAFGNGPGNISGTLDVYFTNTAEGFTGLNFFPGDDSGVYRGSLSVAYSYEPVPEPHSLTLAAVGLLLISARCRYRKAAQQIRCAEPRDNAVVPC